MKYIVTDEEHEWYGKEIEILSNSRAGDLYVCRLKHGTKEERQYEKYLMSQQFSQ